MSAATITPRAWRRRSSHFRVSWQCHIKYISTILLRNIRQSQYRECFLFSFGRIATRHVIMIDVASGGGGEESTCRWACGNTSAHLIIRSRIFFSSKRTFSSFRNTACVFFFAIYCFWTADSPTRGVRHTYTVRQGCGGPIFSRKCNFKGIANWIWGVTAARGGDRRRQVRAKGVDKPFLRFDVIAITHHTLSRAKYLNASGAYYLRSGDDVVSRECGPFVTVLLWNSWLHLQ